MSGENRETANLPWPLWVVPICMSLLALAPLPYGYYMLLRLVVCGACILLVLREHSIRGWGFWAAALGLVALLFNPIFRIHLSRELWIPLNIACAALFAAHLVVNIKRSRLPSA